MSFQHYTSWVISTLALHDPTSGRLCPVPPATGAPLRPVWAWVSFVLTSQAANASFHQHRFLLSFLVQTKLPSPIALSTPSPHQAPSELKWYCSLSNFPSFKSQCLPHHYIFIILILGAGDELFPRKQGRRLKVLFQLSLKTESKKGLRGTIIERLISSQVPSQEKEMTCLPLAKLQSLNIRFLLNKCRFTFS